MKKCVFAGSFNPVTIGHTSIIDTCLKMFDEVVVAFAKNTNKHSENEVNESKNLLQRYYQNNPNVKIIAWDGTIADLLLAEHTNIYVRGVRNSTDYEYETQNFYINKTLCKDIIEIFIPCEQDKLHISSTLVRELIAFRKPYEHYLPAVKES